ncbi:MAG: hypothetical protein R3C28_11375 [Pirellulaceae bacterium]
MGTAPNVDRVRSTILEVLLKIPMLFRGHLREIAATVIGISRMPGIDPREFRRQKKRAYAIAMEAIEPLIQSERLRIYQREGGIYAGRPIVAPPIVSWTPGDPLPSLSDIQGNVEQLIASKGSTLYTGYYRPPDLSSQLLRKQLFSSILIKAEQRQPEQDDEDRIVDRRTGDEAIVAFRIASMFTSLLAYSPDDVSSFELSDKRLTTSIDELPWKRLPISPEAFTTRDGVVRSLYLIDCWRGREIDELFARHRESQVPFQIYPA